MTARPTALDEIHEIIIGPHHLELSPFDILFMAEIQQDGLAALDDTVPIHARRTRPEHGFHSLIQGEYRNLVEKRLCSANANAFSGFRKFAHIGYSGLSF